MKHITLFAMIKVLYCLSYINLILAFRCLDENKQPVDWYVAYKLPAVHHDNKLVEKGLAYIYMTSKNYSSWIPSQIPISSNDSLIANSISSLYMNQSRSFILYNDETPEGTKNSIKGHCKGVVLVNQEGGLWLVHSVPKFPNPTFYDFPDTGTRYGQSFLCISLDLNNLDNVGIQLQYNEPEIYDQFIQNELKTKLPNLSNAALNKTVKNSPWFHQVPIISLDGTNFLSFAKSKKFGKDLYEDLVAPALQSSLLVETWPNGPGRLDSDCTKVFKTKNIETISMDLIKLKFNSTHDHSKWAISNPSSWICIGDINRAEHQEKRGGGTVCLRNEKLSSIYRNLVEDVEECPK